MTVTVMLRLGVHRDLVQFMCVRTLNNLAAIQIEIYLRNERVNI